MSLDRLYHPVAIGQFTGLIPASPGVEDRRYEARRKDARLYKKAAGESLTELSLEKRKLRGWQSQIALVTSAADDVPQELQGNTLVYEIAYAMMTSLRDGYQPTATRMLSDVYAQAVHCASSVIDGTMRPHPTTCRDVSNTSPDGVPLLLRALKEEVMEAYDMATAAHTQRKHKYKAGNLDGNFAVPTEGPNSSKTRISSLGSLVYVTFGRAKVLITPDHFSRLVDLITKMRNLALGLTDMSLRDTFLTWSLICEICRLGTVRQQTVGAAFRVLRAYLIARGADHGKTVSNVIREIMSGFSGPKLEMGLKLIEFCRDLTDSYSELTQISNCYKFIISPDISMKACFNDTFGTKEPNRVTETGLVEFSGLIRKRTFMLLKKAGEPVHATSANISVNNILNKPTPTPDELESIPLRKWSVVKFSPLRSMTTYKDVELKSNDKSSANDLPGGLREEFSEYSAEWLCGKKGKARFKVKPTKENDIKVELQTGESLKPKRGWKKFKELVRNHRKLERDNNVTNPDDLDSSILSKAVRQSEDHRHIINTEPKEGEFHKENGRLFYMATRDMKAFISSVERLCRKIYRGQVGNSIVASYNKRMLQLRSMAAATSNKSDEVECYFTSFDMSEFSKKFPGALVREVGKVFAELTGDEELSRLDVVFRSGLIIHSTRNYEGAYAGAKGGFEGFLNFVWTVCHVTVMELALLKSGKNGLVMAYSDDGLLQIVVMKSTSMEERRDIIQTVMGTYRDLGLIFHLFKTLYATNVFEYLGLIAIDGRFMETWFKSLASFGTTELRSHFTPFLDRVTTVVSQARSAVEYGMPVDYIYYHMLLEIYLIVSRKADGISMPLLYPKAISPVQWGGLGVPTIMSMIVTSENSPASACIAGLLEYLKVYPTIVARYCEILTESKADKHRQMLSLINGDYYATGLLRLDGRSETMKLAEAAAAVSGQREVSDPLTDLVVAKICAITKKLKNVNPQMLAAMIAASPSVQRYTSRLGVASSRGAYNILRRDIIRDCQRGDSKKVSASLIAYSRSMSIPASISGSESLRLLLRTINYTVSSYGFAPLRQEVSALCEFSTKPDGAVLSIAFSRDSDELLCKPSRVKKLDDSIYSAPDMTSGVPDTSPIFHSIDRVDNVLPERMLKAMSKLITQCPDAYEHFVDIALILGAKIPAMPAGIRKSIQRTRAVLKGKPSIILNIPATSFALTTCDFRRPVMNSILEGTASDLSTLPMVAKALSSLHVVRGGCLRGRPSMKGILMYLHMKKDIPLSAVVTESEMSVVEPHSSELQKRESPEVTRMYTKSMTNLLTEMSERGKILTLGQSGAESRKYLSIAIASKVAKRILYTIRNLPLSPLQDDHFMTDDTLSNYAITKDAYLRVALSIIGNPPPSEMGRRKEDFFRLVDERGSELPRFMNEPSYRGLIVGGEYEQYMNECLLCNLVAAGNERMTVVGEDLQPSQFRQVVSETINTMMDNLYNKVGQWRWGGGVTLGYRRDPPMTPAQHGGLSVDTVLDCLTAMKVSLRGSRHRRELYNKTTFAIMYTKLVLISRRYAMKWQRHSREDARVIAKDLTLSEREIKMVLLAYSNGLGPDHKELVASPAGEVLAKRIGTYARSSSTRGDVLRMVNGDLKKASPSHLLRVAAGHQTFMNNAIMRFMNTGVEIVNPNKLRSPESLNVMSGRFALQRINLSTKMEVPSMLKAKNGARHMGACALILARTLDLLPLKIVFKEEIGLEDSISRKGISELGTLGITVLDASDEVDDIKEDKLIFNPFPGEENAEKGRFYYMSILFARLEEAVKCYAKLHSLGEFRGDIIQGASGYTLSGAVLAENDVLEPTAGSLTSTSTESTIDSVTLAHLVTADFPLAEDIRLTEAGILQSERTPFSLNPDILATPDTGLGSTRQGGIRGRLVPGEYALVAAGTHGFRGADVNSLVFSAALVYASLSNETNEGHHKIIDDALRMIKEWETVIIDSSPMQQHYIRLGVIATIDRALTWLSVQNFQLPTDQVIPEELLALPTGIAPVFSGAGGSRVFTSRVTSNAPLGVVRDWIRSGRGFESESLLEASPDEQMLMFMEQQPDLAIVPEAEDDDAVSSLGSHDT